MLVPGAHSIVFMYMEAIVLPPWDVHHIGTYFSPFEFQNSTLKIN